MTKMFTLKVKKIEKQLVQEDKEKFLDVWIDILKCKKVVESRRLGFSYRQFKNENPNEREIMAELKKWLVTYNSDYKMAQANKKANEQEANAEKVVENLTGAVI